MFPDVQAVYVTRENWDDVLPMMQAGMEFSDIIGLDIETEDSRRHPGLVEFNKGNRSLAFDINRTTVCGISLWPENWPQAYYINLAHADVMQRVDWLPVRELLDSKPSSKSWVIHNAAFELVMMKCSLDYDIRDYIDTLTMAVSAYGPDEYNFEYFQLRDLEDMGKLVPEIVENCREKEQTPAMQETLAKLIGKASDATHSWNGYVKQMAYGYGLKAAVKSWFGHDMPTFEATLGEAAHMGELTGKHVCEYGASDAIWCVRLYRQLLNYMMFTNPQVVQTFFNQENPMVRIYADTQRKGVRINARAVTVKQHEIRAEYAELARKLKAEIRALMPFDPVPHPELFKRESWYAKNHAHYRDIIAKWAVSADSPDDYTEATKLSGAIPNAWTVELGRKPAKALNLTHYMPMRVIMYDLFRREKLILSKGKVQSDAAARGRLKESLTGGAANVMGLMGNLATIEQVSKLYITPYRMLVDPDTERLHPVMGSELATRRTSMRTPNAQQLSKRNPETTYVRGFFLADNEDHVIVSCDWSQIELVLIGEESGDPYFRECFGQIPYKDLHIVAAADALGVPVEKFKSLKTPGFIETHGADDPLLLNPRGEAMEPADAFKYWRTEVGKGSNFNYWYSGALSTIGERLNWTSEEMWEATERYRQRFSVAERWRQDQIEALKIHGSTNIIDGHRRVRPEATPMWQRAFMSKWPKACEWFADIACRRIQSRANNQAINAKIQGACATLAKRTIQRVDALGWADNDARFMFLVHDELVYSVHRSRVQEFIPLLTTIMCDHPEIISTLKIDCTASVGLTFEPWNYNKARLGQIELSELPKELGLVNPSINDVVDWLFRERSNQCLA